MTYRNLEQLTKIEITKKFCKKYNLDLTIAPKGLFFENKSLILHVYGFYIEDVLYFDFSSKNSLKKMSADLIIENYKFSEDFRCLYEVNKRTHLYPFSDLINSNNERNTISSEIDYLTYLQVFINHFEEIFSGNVLKL